MKDTERMRRRRSFALRLLAVCFILLFLVRNDWLAAVFFNTNQSEHSRRDLFLQEKAEQPRDTVPQQKQQNVLRKVMENDKNLRSDYCPIPHLKNKVDAQGNVPLCQRIKVHKSTCKVAKELFGHPLDLNIPKACKTSHDREFCRIVGSVNSWKVSCDISICDKQVYLSTTDITNGKLTWTSYNKRLPLQNSIQNLIGTNNFGFCVIVCSENEPTYKTKVEDYSDMIFNDEDIASYYDGETQILNLPPKDPQNSNNSKRDNVNINMVFVDSVSRNHLYRSLPRFVEKLDDIAGDESALVLDFELVQGVRSRTFETLQTLFSGSINPFELPFGTQEMPRERLKIDKLFIPFKDLGYSTLWLEDLCPYWEWGLSKDLLVYNKTDSREILYRKFQAATKAAGIDSLGNTFSSCDILDANNVPDPFHAPDKMCYNGQHQHEYLLSYLETYQRIMTQKSQPFLSFFETNVGHEGTGKRIQYFDTAFAEYIDYAKSLVNTLTIVFSDHGNAYGELLNRATEGRVEIYHPFMFMIIPDRVKSFFNEKQLNALKINQNRLVSVLDLHYTLTNIIELLQDSSKPVFKSEVSEFNKQFNVSRRGLLEEVNPGRTCSHMPRIMPNSCICEGYDITKSNTAYHFILAAYFIGMVNNDIQKSRRRGVLGQKDSIMRTKGKTLGGGFGSCQRMKVKKIKNIQESKLDDVTTAKMDLYVVFEGQTVDEIFFISIQIKQTSGFSFSSFDRITPYNKYKICSDSGVDLKVCVCNRNSPTNSSTVLTSHSSKHKALDKSGVKDILKSIVYPDLTRNITSISVDGKECLYIISQSNNAGVIYDVFNNCLKSFKMKFLFHTENLLLSAGHKVVININHNDVTFVTAGVRESQNDWSCDLKVSFTM